MYVNKISSSMPAILFFREISIFDLGDLPKSSLFTGLFFIVYNSHLRVESHNVIFVRNLASWTRLFGRLWTRRAVLECCIDLQQVIEVAANALPPFFPFSDIEITGLQK